MALKFMTVLLIVLVFLSGCSTPQYTYTAPEGTTAQQELKDKYDCSYSYYQDGINYNHIVDWDCMQARKGYKVVEE